MKHLFSISDRFNMIFKVILKKYGLSNNENLLTNYLITIY